MSAGRELCSGRARIEAQTWGSSPPFPPVTLYRAACSCGWKGLWYRYRENAQRESAHVALTGPRSAAKVPA